MDISDIFEPKGMKKEKESVLWFIIPIALAVVLGLHFVFGVIFRT